jgi:thiol-disulfide isomerase/thioredoxin
LKNPAGKVLRLSALKGKVVLIDFWASWCGPCRRENPNVVKLYKKYKSKGFEIFSVSLDEDPKAWKQAIAQDGLSWPNHVSDLLGWQTPLIQSYRFDGIPHTVLLDRKGQILSTGLRGSELEQKLIEALAK